MWNWHEGKVALEHLFFTGRVAAARRVNFERLYDTTERVIPAEILARPTPSPADAQRELVRIAARALGVATEPDLGDYFRLPRRDSKARVAELVEGGELTPVEVEGWTAPAYLWPAARRPRKLHARALLSPFDSLIWFRAADRAAVRLPLPHRDLHAGGETGLRLLRAAVPARRSAGRAGRPEVGPHGGRPARSGRRSPSRTSTGRTSTGARRPCARRPCARRPGAGAGAPPGREVARAGRRGRRAAGGSRRRAGRRNRLKRVLLLDRGQP